MQQQDDMLVIRMVLQGRLNAYAILVDRYRVYVFTLVLRYVEERETAEELAQDVFIKAYRNLADFKGDSKFSTWLYTIVNTTCLSYLRKKKDDTLLLEQGQMLRLSGNTHSHNDMDSTIKQKSRKQLLAKAIDCLPPEDARIITLFYLAEQTLEEVAVILGITANNAKVKLYRARVKLREVLETKFKNELV